MGICKSFDDCRHYLKITLLFRESIKSTNTEAPNIIFSDLKKIFDFLLRAKALEFISSKDENSLVCISRFGRSVFESGLNTDEAILFYEDLLKAQENMYLETNLHLLYLITPLTHSFVPG